MIIKGYAFKKDEREIQKKYSDRFSEISHLRESIRFEFQPDYARTHFSGELLTEEAMKLSEFDIALLADSGNLCFGGECTKYGNRFRGSYCTD